MKTMLDQPAIRSPFSPEDASANLPMKTRTKGMLTSLAITLAVVFSTDAALGQQGDALKYVLKTAMANAGIDADATGTVNLTMNRNRNGDNQRLKVVLTKLDPDTTYQLNAFLGNDTAPTSLGALIDRCGNDIAGNQWPGKERTTQHLAGADQSQVFLRGRQLHAARRLYIGRSDLDLVANAYAGIATLKAVQPDDIQPLVFGIRRQSDGGRAALADDFNDLAVTRAHGFQALAADPRGAGPDILRLCAGDL